jgi:hypothetical protein
MGDILKEHKGNFSLSKKLWTKKYPSRRFNHLSTTSTSIWPSNKGISKLTCTLKGEAPPKWLIDEDVFLVGIHQRICAKLSIISFLCHTRASLRNSVKGSPAPSSLFSSSMGGFHDRWGRSYKGSTTSSPNFLYPNLIGYIHMEKNKENTSMIPLI